MVTEAALVKFLIASAQPVAAACEHDRLAYICEHKWKGWEVACEAKDRVPEKLMPKPSAAWVAAWASATFKTPLFPGLPKYESVWGLVWAEKESNYDDKVTTGDGGKSGCSLGVMPESFGTTMKNITEHPSECVYYSRVGMRRSFVGWPDHPMALYAGGRNPTAAAISDARAQLVKQLVAKLPDIEE